MKLNTFERLVLLNNLPAEGDLTTIRIVRELREALSFTEAEHATLNFRQLEDEGGKSRVEWEAGADKETDIPMGPKALGVVRKQLEKLSKDGKLTEAHLSVCDKFEVGA